MNVHESSVVVAVAAMVAVVAVVMAIVGHGGCW